MDEALRRAARDHLIRYTGDIAPAIFTSAKGCVVRDDEGREYLDFTSGQMCATIGHSHPAIVKALKEAANDHIHLFSGMIPDTVARLAARLVDWMPAPLKRSVFVNTGGESNEVALRLAKIVTGGYEIVGLGGSWHGTTGGAAAASYASDRRGYGPKVPGMHVIPEPNAYRCPVGHCRDSCDMTCLKVGLSMFDMKTDGAGAAFIAEPVLSAAGVIVPPEGYFEKLKSEAEARGMMLIFDEAQTAFGRLGHKTAAEKLGVTPDIMSISKTLGGGLPLAGTVTTDEIEERAHEKGFAYYTSHVSDPLPAAAGLAVLDTLEEENLLERATEMGGYLKKGLQALQQKYEAIGDIRGEGMLYGIELVKDRESREPHHELGAITTRLCFERGLSMNIKRREERGSIWRIAPPLTVTSEEIDRGMEILDGALRDGLDEATRN